MAKGTNCNDLPHMPLWMWLTLIFGVFVLCSAAVWLPYAIRLYSWLTT